MNGFTAIGHMLLEEGRIVSVRHEERGVQVDHDKVVEGQVFTTARVDQEADGWELGWSCPKCMGDGIVSVPCGCQGRSLRSLLENPCCDGWDDEKRKDLMMYFYQRIDRANRKERRFHHPDQGAFAL